MCALLIVVRRAGMVQSTPQNRNARDASKKGSQRDKDQAGEGSAANSDFLRRRVTAAGDNDHRFLVAPLAPAAHASAVALQVTAHAAEFIWAHRRHAHAASLDAKRLLDVAPNSWAVV